MIKSKFSHKLARTKARRLSEEEGGIFLVYTDGYYWDAMPLEEYEGPEKYIGERAKKGRMYAELHDESPPEAVRRILNKASPCNKAEE